MATGSRRPAASRPKGRGSSTRPKTSTIRTAPPAAANTAGRGAALSVRRVLTMGSVALMLLLLLGPTAKTYFNQRAEIATLRENVSSQRADVAALEREKSLWANKEYVEQQARERLKFVKVGEKAYSIIDVQQVAPDTAATEAAAVSNRPWYGELWESAKLADNPQLASHG